MCLIKNNRGKNMKKYEIKKNTREISYKNRDEIHEGCTLEQRIRARDKKV